MYIVTVSQFSTSALLFDVVFASSDVGKLLCESFRLYQLDHCDI